MFFHLFVSTVWSSSRTQIIFYHISGPPTLQALLMPSLRRMRRWPVPFSLSPLTLPRCSSDLNRSSKDRKTLKQWVFQYWLRVTLIFRYSRFNYGVTVVTKEQPCSVVSHRDGDYKLVWVSTVATIDPDSIYRRDWKSWRRLQRKEYLI